MASKATGQEEQDKSLKNTENDRNTNGLFPSVLEIKQHVIYNFFLNMKKEN